MDKELARVFFSVPIHRTHRTSFWIGVEAVVVALALAALLAAALAGLFVLLKVNFGGTVITIVFGLLWFGLFFLSHPLQRRYARSFDLLRPGIRLAGGVLVLDYGGTETWFEREGIVRRVTG